METIFMNTENKKTKEPHRFRLTFVDKFNLKDPNKNISLAHLTIYYLFHITTVTFKFLPQLEMMNLICLLIPTLHKIFKIILNRLSKNKKLW